MDFVADAPEGRAGLLTEVRALEKAFSKVALSISQFVDKTYFWHSKLV